MKINFIKKGIQVIKHTFITIGLNALATLLSLLIIHIGFTEVNVVVLYILSVLIISRYTKGYIYGIIASIISTLAFNYFFTDPLYTFTVDDKTYIFTFILMLLTALFTSTLTSKLIESGKIFEEKEKQTRVLYYIASSLAKTSGISEVAVVSAQCVSNLFECDAFCLLVNKKKETVVKYYSEKNNRGIDTENITIDELDRLLKDYTSHPIYIQGEVVSYICIPYETEKMLSTNSTMLESVFTQITVAIEREYLTAEKEIAKSETEKEKIKNNLLRAISHDLRTPLSAIHGAAEILLQNCENTNNKEIAQGICEDSGWLIRLVENILSLTKIQEGKMLLEMKLEAIEEIVSEAVSRARKYAPEYTINASVPEKVIFIPMEAKLIEQVLINLIDNAVKHSTKNNPINLTVNSNKDKIWFVVSDTGIGIKDEDISKIFELFYVSNKDHMDSRRGIGIGLTICKAIVNFHGGEIYASNNENGGATFKFYLKLRE